MKKTFSDENKIQEFVKNLFTKILQNFTGIEELPDNRQQVTANSNEYIIE